jgi:membrane protease YdiL (CAAX protease family)
VLDPASEPSSRPLGVPADAAAEPPSSAEAAPTYGPRRTLPVERIGAFIEVVLCSGLPTQILVFSALTGLGLQYRTADGGWSPPFLVAMSLADMVLIIGLVYLFLRAHHEPLRQFIVGHRRPLREVALGLALIPAALVLVVLVLTTILALKPELHNVTVNPFERMLQTPRDAAVFAFVVMFAGGLREEVQRAFIIRRFDQYLGGGLAGILGYSGIFGIGHLDQGYAAAIATGVLGAAWGFLYWSRGSVIAPIVSHAGFNLVQLVKFAVFAGAFASSA